MSHNSLLDVLQNVRRIPRGCTSPTDFIVQCFMYNNWEDNYSNYTSPALENDALSLTVLFGYNSLSYIKKKNVESKKFQTEGEYSGAALDSARKLMYILMYM